MRASYCNLALADDDHAVRKSLAFLLALTGNQVVDYASADEFLQAGWGWQLPVLLVTGAPSPAIAARAAWLGIPKVLEKPSAEADIMAFIDGLGG